MYSKIFSNNVSITRMCKYVIIFINSNITKIITIFKISFEKTNKLKGVMNNAKINKYFK